VERGQRAIEVVELITAVAESLKADRAAGWLICAALARATSSEAAVWVALREGEPTELIGTYPEQGATALSSVVLAAELPVSMASTIRDRASSVGEVLYLAPRGPAGAGQSGVQRVLALAKRRGFTAADEALANEALPALSMMLPQVIATSERKRRESVRLAGARELGLTGRELEVLQFLAQGLLATSIASRLDLSPRTVHKHLGNIYEKMGVHDRLVAVSLARQLGLVNVDR
jgi:DNA-binding CsgD family transcriptional regulator